MNSFSIGVFPSSELGTLKRLFKALEEAFPRSFQGPRRGTGEAPRRNCRGFFLFTRTPPILPKSRQDCAALPFLNPLNIPDEEAKEIIFASGLGLDPRLRGLSLLEEKAKASPPLPAKEGDEVFCLNRREADLDLARRGEGSFRLRSLWRNWMRRSGLWEQLRRAAFYESSTFDPFSARGDGGGGLDLSASAGLR